MDDEELYRVTTPDQASWLVTAYLQAVHGAAPLRADLITAGLYPDDLTVTAGLSEHGTAAVHVTVLPVVAAHLAELITPTTIGHPRVWQRRIRGVIRTWPDVRSVAGVRHRGMGREHGPSGSSSHRSCR
jgi:hypothetical protein